MYTATLIAVSATSAAAVVSHTRSPARHDPKAGALLVSAVVVLLTAWGFLLGEAL